MSVSRIDFDKMHKKVFDGMAREPNKYLADALKETSDGDKCPKCHLTPSGDRCMRQYCPNMMKPKTKS